MKRMLFTIPDMLANDFQQLVPIGERSGFVVRYIEIPLKELKNKKKKKAVKTSSIYKTSFLKALRRAESQAARGEVINQEEVMKKFGLL